MKSGDATFKAGRLGDKKSRAITFYLATFSFSPETTSINSTFDLCKIKKGASQTSAVRPFCCLALLFAWLASGRDTRGLDAGARHRLGRRDFGRVGI